MGRQIARMERRELDGDAHRLGQPPALAGPGLRLADRLDRLGIGAPVASGVVPGARALSQHVEGVAVALRLVLRSAGQRVLDRLAEDEMVAQEAHRLPRRGAHRRHAEPADEALHDAFGRIARLQHPCRKAERPGRSGNEPRLAVRLVLAPAAFAQLVLDQPVLGGRVRHAQQRFGQHHHRQPLARRKAVFAQEILDTAHRARLVADRHDHPSGAPVDRLVLDGVHADRRQMVAHDEVVIAPIGRIEPGGSGLGGGSHRDLQLMWRDPIKSGWGLSFELIPLLSGNH